jgi:general secretion pathway protein K
MNRPLRSTSTRSRGAAVLMALFVATLATLIVSGLFWTQFVLLRTIENQQLVSQSRLLLRGALDWARAILREDARTSNFDAISEPWGQRLEETRLDQLGETSALAAQATMSGDIEDAQSRFNLRGLVQDGQVSEAEVAALARLTKVLNLPEQTANLIANHMAQALAVSDINATTPKPKPIPLVFPQDIGGISGISAEAAAKLAAYVVVLDEARTPINVNTAPAEVLVARIPGLTLSEANAAVGQRRRTDNRFRNTGDFRNIVGAKANDVTDELISTASRYFFVRGRIKLDRADTRMEALVKRSAPRTPGPITVLWQRECDACKNPRRDD